MSGEYKEAIRFTETQGSRDFSSDGGGEFRDRYSSPADIQENALVETASVSVAADQPVPFYVCGLQFSTTSGRCQPSHIVRQRREKKNGSRLKLSRARQIKEAKQESTHKDLSSSKPYPLPVSPLENKMKKIRDSISKDNLEVLKLTEALAKARMKDSQENKLKPPLPSVGNKPRQAMRNRKGRLLSDKSLFEFSEASTCVTNLTVSSEQNEWLQFVNESGHPYPSDCTSDEEFLENSLEDSSSEDWNPQPADGEYLSTISHYKGTIQVVETESTATTDDALSFYTVDNSSHDNSKKKTEEKRSGSVRRWLSVKKDKVLRSSKHSTL